MPFFSSLTLEISRFENLRCVCHLLKNMLACFDCRHQIATERQIANWQMSNGDATHGRHMGFIKKKRDRWPAVDPKLMETKHRTFCVTAVPAVCTHWRSRHYASVIMCVHTPFSTIEWSMTASTNRQVGLALSYDFFRVFILFLFRF